MILILDGDTDDGGGIVIFSSLPLQYFGHTTCALEFIKGDVAITEEPLNVAIGVNLT
jgi:hypothetical protein